MGAFIKTCLAHVLVLAAIAVPVLGSGCERQAEPPVVPRSQSSPSVPPDSGARRQGSAPAEPVRADDAGITARVKTALLADEAVKGLAIDVDTRDGRVTLKGQVADDAQIAHAIEVTRGVEGVRDVINRLSVKAEDKAATSTRG